MGMAEDVEPLGPSSARATGNAASVHHSFITHWPAASCLPRAHFLEPRLASKGDIVRAQGHSVSFEAALSMRHLLCF